MSAYAISAADLDIVERSLQDLASNLGGVNKHVGEVTNHLYDVENNVKTVTSNVKSLEEEIKAFMIEIRESSIVSNARQTILMNQTEIDKKFGHYDEIRRRISGILQSADIKAVRKDTLLDISEKTIVDAPNYWLAPALVAICAWYLDNKALADRALDEAIKRDDEKTSLLFSLVHLRAGRIDASIKWLDRYLSMQNPSKMEPKIITVIDAITNGNFGDAAINLFLEKLKLWKEELASIPEIKEEQIIRWNKYFDSFKEPVSNSCFPYLLQYGSNVDRIKDISSISLAKTKIYNRLQDIFNAPNTTNNDVDALVNDLVYNYENEELDLNREIAKNKLIILENGNTKKALEKFEDSKYSLKRYNSFYDHLTNVSLDYSNITCSGNTRKFAIAYTKDFISEGYKRYMQIDNFDRLPEIKITIGEWIGTTKIGNNEKELSNDLTNFLKNKYHNAIYGEKFFNIKMLISIIIGIISIIFLYKYPIIMLVLLLLIAAFNGFEIYKASQNRQAKINYLNNLIKQNLSILQNTLAEVVDYYSVYKKSINYDNEFNTFINNINYNNYIKGGR